MLAAFDPHVAVDEELRQVLVELSRCRDPGCLVPQRHPRYLDEHGPAAPCEPVVPTRVVTGGVMVLGAYPNTRYSSRSGNHFVASADIDEPFEDSAYFDGYGVREHLSGALLETAYLRPLGLSRSEVYVTNVVKCFLLRRPDVDGYARLRFPGADRVRPTRDDYLQVAAHCHRRWLARELAIAKPKLVICLGSEVFSIVHASGGRPADRGVFAEVCGTLMPANGRGHDRDTRDEAGPFFGLNVVHLYHPGALLRDEKKSLSRLHFRDHVPAVRRVLKGLGLVSGRRPRVPRPNDLAPFRTRLANEAEDE